jgi:hypothetical protein
VIDLTPVEAAFLRFHAEDPLPTNWTFHGAPASVRAVKVVRGKQVTLDLGPFEFKRIARFFHHDMRLRPEGLKLARELVVQ